MIAFLKFLQFIFRFIFLLPADAALARMRGTADLVYRIARRTKIKRMAANNFRLVLPDRDAADLADKLLKNVSLSIFEVLCTPFFKKDHFKKIIQWTGLEKLNEALGNGKGVIMVTLHAGNYELINTALAHYGYKMNVIQRSTDDPIFNLVNRSRSAAGTKMINVLEQDMYKEALKIIRENEIIGLLADTGALESRYEKLDFLGKKVPVATGWITLAQRAGCPVIPVVIRREGTGQHITLYDPITITKANRDESIKKILKIFEEYIKQNPQEWLIFLNSYETERMLGLRD